MKIPTVKTRFCHVCKKRAKVLRRELVRPDILHEYLSCGTIASCYPRPRKGRKVWEYQG